MKGSASSDEMRAFPGVDLGVKTKFFCEPSPPWMLSSPPAKEYRPSARQRLTENQAARAFEVLAPVHQVSTQPATVILVL